MNHLSDEIIMENVKLGNIENMTELFYRYNNQVLSYFIQLSGNIEDSKDLTQTVFLRILKYRKSFNSSMSFKAWIYSVSKNVLNNYWQSKKPETDRLEAIGQIEDIKYTASESDIKLYKSLDKLSDEYKELIVLSKFQGLKYKEIADIFSTTEAFVKNKVYRALNNLRILFFEND